MLKNQQKKGIINNRYNYKIYNVESVIKNKFNFREVTI